MRIQDNGDLRRYRTEVPNIIDDMGLSPFAYRLYGHLKRVAGESGGCWEGIRRLAESCNMSVGAVRSAKAELVQADLITVERGSGEQADVITINDVWLENMMRYASRQDADEIDDNGWLAQRDDAGLCDFGRSFSRSSARMVTHPRASSDTPPRATRHTPARVVTQPRACGDTQERTNEEGTNEEGGEIGAGAPPAPSAAQTVDEALDGKPATTVAAVGSVKAITQQPAIQAYHGVFLAYPSRPLMVQMLAHGIDDMARWERALSAWCRRGYNPLNIAGMLDWYDNPEKMDGRPSKTTTTTTGSGGRAGQDNRPAWANYQPVAFDAELAAELNAGR